MGLWSAIKADIQKLVGANPALQGLEALAEKELQSHLASVEASANAMVKNLVAKMQAALATPPATPVAASTVPTAK